MPQTAFRPNHMHIAWHDYTSHDATLPISAAPLREKASVIGRTGLMLLSCGTGAWRVRSSMNTLAEELGLVCAADIGLTSIEYTCFDGEQAFSQTLTLTSTGVNTSKLNRLEQFVAEFADSCSRMTGEQLHPHLDEIEQVPGLYLYRVIYNLGTMNLSISASWFASATLIILALPLGLIFARMMTDKMFRYCT